MTYTIKRYKGSEIRVSNKKGVGDKYWATAFSGMIAVEGSTKTIALNKAKAKVNSAIRKAK